MPEVLQRSSNLMIRIDGQTDVRRLGRWTLAARTALKTGGKVNLRVGLPASVTVVFAENQAQRNMDYQLAPPERQAVNAFEQNAQSPYPLSITARILDVSWSTSCRRPAHDRDGGAAGGEDRPYVRSDLLIKKLVCNVDDG